jgi:pimeloyl-ACP methyl ester carboxylesterase
MPAIVTTLALTLGAAPPLLHSAYAAWVRRRFPAVGEFTVHKGSRLHHVRAGSGPPVVLIHGANGTWNDFPPELIADLARDHTVLAMDRPGHGWSEASLSGPLGLAENAWALLSLLRGQHARKATLVGHSYGAAVALRAALEAPDLVSHVVAVAPCTMLDPRNTRYARAPLVGMGIGRLLFEYVSLGLYPFAAPLRADAWHPEPPPAGFGASRAFAYVPSQMHASARNFRSLGTDLEWVTERLSALPRQALRAGRRGGPRHAAVAPRRLAAPRRARREHRGGAGRGALGGAAAPRARVGRRARALGRRAAGVKRARAHARSRHRR